MCVSATSSRSVTPPTYCWLMSSQMTNLRFTAKCSPFQHRRLDEVLAISCEMHNAPLEAWEGTYAWWREHNPAFPQVRGREGQPHPTRRGIQTNHSETDSRLSGRRRKWSPQNSMPEEPCDGHSGI